jgi:plastocyanin
MKKILILLFVIVIVLITCGCTESAPEVQPTPVPTIKTPSPTYLPKTTFPTPEQTVLSVNENIISIKREGFSPATLSVKKGQRVTWLNVDTTEDPALYNPTHRIEVRNVFKSQILQPGISGSWIFDNAGVYDYQDMIHTDLKGTVTVV